MRVPCRKKGVPCWSGEKHEDSLRRARVARSKLQSGGRGSFPRLKTLRYLSGAHYRRTFTGRVDGEIRKEIRRGTADSIQLDPGP